jgi:acyl carrier protein
VSVDKISVIIDIVSSISRISDEIQAETKIIEDGYIDSLNVFHIIAELETKFNISIGVMDATVEDFTSPHNILALVERIDRE